MTTSASPLGEAPEIVDDVRGVQMAVVGQILDVADRRVALERVDARQPGATDRAGSTCGSHSSSAARRSLAIADVDADVLVELGAIDVDVDLLRRRRVGLQVAGDAIVEPHAERDQEVGFLNRVCSPTPRRASPSSRG